MSSALGPHTPTTAATAVEAVAEKNDTAINGIPDSHVTPATPGRDSQSVGRPLAAAPPATAQRNPSIDLEVMLAMCESHITVLLVRFSWKRWCLSHACRRTHR
jgi:hypothetical protein